MYLSAVEAEEYGIKSFDFHCEMAIKMFNGQVSAFKGSRLVTLTLDLDLTWQQ